MRGDDKLGDPFGDPIEGSAPRARGRRNSCWGGDVCLRISPACAGTTLSSDSRYTVSEDQPRVRGDDPLERPQTDGNLGSAPRARGRPEYCGVTLKRPGISPACAGTTSDPWHRSATK